MITKRRHTLRAWLVLAALGGMIFAVAPAHATTPPGFYVTPDPMTPYTSGGAYTPIAPFDSEDVIGKADPGAKITLTVSDAYGTPPAVFTTFAATQFDEGSGTQPGDWFIRGPQVTDFGLHGTTPSTVIFTAVATVAGVNSLPVAVSVTKNSATPNDTAIPGMRLLVSPSCASETGLACPGSFPNDISHIFDCRPNTIPPHCPWPYSRVQFKGQIDDFSPTYGGPSKGPIASEISDIEIIIKDGATVVKDYHANKQPDVTRRGTQAFFSVDFLVTDFEVLKTYSWSIQSFDAWGNGSAKATGSFMRMPL